MNLDYSKLIASARKRKTESLKKRDEVLPAILKKIYELTNFAEEELLSSARTGDLIAARGLLIVLLKEAGVSFSAIAITIKRNISTVQYHYKHLPFNPKFNLLKQQYNDL